MLDSANVVTGSNFRVGKCNKPRDRSPRNFVPVTIFAGALHFRHRLLTRGVPYRSIAPEFSPGMKSVLLAAGWVHGNNFRTGAYEHSQPRTSKASGHNCSVRFTRLISPQGSTKIAGCKPTT